MIPGLDSDQCPRSEAKYMDGGIGQMLPGLDSDQCPMRDAKY